MPTDRQRLLFRLLAFLGVGVLGTPARRQLLCRLPVFLVTLFCRAQVLDCDAYPLFQPIKHLYFTAEPAIFGLHSQKCRVCRAVPFQLFAEGSIAGNKPYYTLSTVRHLYCMGYTCNASRHNEFTLYEQPATGTCR